MQKTEMKDNDEKRSGKAQGIEPDNLRIFSQIRTPVRFRG